MQSQPKYFHGIFSMSGLMSLLFGMFFLFLLSTGLNAQDQSAIFSSTGRSVMVIPTITGPASVCEGVAGYVYSTEAGMTGYVWTVSAGGTVTSGAGTNSITVTWGSAGTETVTVTYVTASVPALLSVTVSPFSNAAVSISASSNPVCAGVSVSFTAIPLNGGSSPNYQWKVNGFNVGSSSNTFSYIPSNGDVVTCQLTSNLLCVTGNPASATPITMAVTPNLAASVFITASANPVCQGTPVTFSANPLNGGATPVYQWKVNGINSGINSPAFIYSPVNGDVVTCVMTSSVQCITGNPATSNPVNMSVSPSQPVSVTITASANPACQGSSVTFNATPVNGGITPVFQWRVNGATVGGNSASMSYVPNNGDLVSCILTSNASCTSGNPATSNVVAMAVTSSQPVSVTISASVNPVCEGNPVSFTAIPSNGGTSPTYQWTINGFNVGTNAGTFSFIPANGDVVNCQLTSSILCTTGNPASAIPVVMNVLPVLPVNITISASANPVCIGSSVNFTAVPYNGGSSPFYQWKVNGVNVGTNNAVYTYVPVNGDAITCQLTSNAMCTSGNNALSNVVTMTVSPNQVVGVSITAASSIVCQGMTADFTATPTNGGSSPAYQWKVNGVNAGTNSSFFSYFPADGDVVTCQMTSSAVCTIGNPVTSNAVTLSVTTGQTLPVSITIMASANPSCIGQSVSYTATPVNGGTTPVYQWIVNGLNVGTNSPSFTYIPSNGDFVRCQLTSSYLCATGNPALSNQVNMTVNPILAPGISIGASANPSCQGTPVTFTATAVNTGSAPVYQWKVNGINSGTNQVTFSYAPTQGDVVTCQLNSSIPCPVSNPVTATAITMSVLPVQPVSISIAASNNPSCQFTQVVFTATSTNGGSAPVYQWKLNGNNVGSNTSNYSVIPVNGDVVTCRITSNATCVSGDRIVTSSPITMVVSAELIPGVSIVASANPFCQGLPVTFTATPVNGGTPPVYQWKVNCINVGTNSPNLNYVPIDGDFVTCQLTSSLTCAVMNPAISNAITLSVNKSTPASVTVAVLENPVCSGSMAIFTATPVNGGSSPAYNWKVNGSNIGTNNSSYSYIPLNGDIISCTLTSNATCVSNSPSTSAPVSMLVSNALPASVTIATKTNPFCNGSVVIFTATPTNGGPVPVYQWQVNGVNSGAPSSNPVFSYSPVNGDVVKCNLTSNATCITGSNPVMSNQIVMSASASLTPGITISASANNICQGTAVTYSAIPVNGGENPVFQWMVNGLNTGVNNPQHVYSPLNGDVVTCKLTSGLGCAASNPATSNAVTMAVNPTLPVSVAITSSINPCCFGTSVTFNAISLNGGTLPSYQWKVNCANVGTNSPTFTYVPVNGDVVVCVLTSNAPCNTGSPATSNNVNMVVLPLLPVSVTIETSVNPFCVGTPVTFTADPINEGLLPIYQWKVNGVNFGTNNSTFIHAPSDGDIITCQVTSSLSCVSSNPALSNQIIMVGNSALPVSVSISSSLTTLCQGTMVTLIAAVTNGGSSPTYQWKINGLNVGTNHWVYQYVPAIGDVISCYVTSSLNCATPIPAISNVISLNVNPQLPVSVLVTSSANPSCLGVTVDYTAIVTNGGSSPIYRWKVNGLSVGINSPNFSYIPINGDIVSCRVTSNAPCATGNPSNSNNVTMIVNPNAPASISINSSSNPVCQGTPVTYTATPFNGGTLPEYQWKVNGINAGTNSPSFTCTPLNGDVLTCQMISNSPCTPVTQVTSNPITMTVSPIQPVSVSISASANPTCIGSMVSFSATAVNGGSSPVYQWKVNGNVAGSNSSAYLYTPLTGDVVTCSLNSNASCSIGNPATSNAITMTVSESLPVGVSISASLNPSCQGQPVSFSAISANGGINPLFQWRINGIDVGTNSPNFSYSPSNGDFVTCQLTSSFSCGTGNPAASNQISMVVNPSVPVSVSISSSSNPVCLGNPVTFTANGINAGTTPVYQWKVNGINQGANLSAYTYTPANGDVVDCQLTSSATCPLGNPVNSIPITMNVLPPVAAGIFITPSINPICPGIDVTFSSSITNGGSSPLLQWSVNGVIAALNVPSFSYTPTNGDIVTCQLTSNAPCVTGAVATSNQVVMVVSTNLAVNVTISASANPACQGQVVNYTALGTNGGASPVYQWMVNGINVGTSSPDFAFTPATGDVITCRLLSDLSCATGNPALSNAIIMVVSQSLPVGVSISVSSNPVCIGSPVTFTATPVNGGSNPVYQWKVNGINAGINTPFYTFIPTNGDIVTCQILSVDGCTVDSSATSNAINMVVSADLPVSISILASVNPVCQGIPVTYTAVASNGGNNPGYQWKVNGMNAGFNVPSFAYTPADGDVITCVLTSDLPCATGNPATSNAIVTSVYSGQAVGVSLAASPAGVVCQGTTVVLTATPVNGGIPFYQWFKNGISVGTNLPTYSFVPTNGDLVYVVMTSGLSCVSGNPATSNIVAMSVDTPVPAGVSIVSDQNDVCLGTNVTFTATPVNGGIPTYQWYKNGIPVGLNQPTYTDAPVNGDQVYVMMTSGLACVSGSPAVSNTIIMDINAPLPVAVTIVESQNNICEGSSVTYTATPLNGGTSGYQWFVNNLPVGLNQSTYTNIPSNGDQVKVVMTSTLTCISGSPATSNTISMAVNPILPASVSIVSDLNNICQGTAVTFSATPLNGGMPFYQWYKNNLPVGLNQSTYTYTPNNNDQVFVVLTSSQACVTGSPATSNVVTMSVNAPFPASVTIVSDQNNVCQGTPVTFTATPVNGGTPTYQWYRNTIPVGLNQATYSVIPADGDQVSVVMTSGLSCVSGSPAASNMVVMAINEPLPVAVSITASQNSICQGAAVTYTATPSNGGTPVYQWYVNNLPVGLNQSTFTNIPANGDEVRVVMTSTMSCISGSPATSNTINMVVNPILPVSVVVAPDQNNVCQGTSVTFTATPINGGTPSYQWFKNTLPVGLNQSSFTFVPTNGDQVYVVMTSNLSCISGSPATSNMVTMAVYAPLPVSVAISPDQNNVCQGVSVTLTAVPVNGGAPAYQWYKNTLPVGLNQSTYAFTPANGDQVYVVMTSGLACVSGNPATSNTVSMIVNPILPAGVSITASQNNICQGTTVTYTATPSNGGTPGYQWYVNSLPVGLNQSTFTNIPSNGDQVKVVMTSTLACISGSPATSNTINMVVNPILPVSVIVAPDQNNVCQGTTVTFTATPINGGSPTYQWYKNTLPVGVNQSTYTFVPLNGDQVYVVMTSNLSCLSGSPATSNVVTMSVNAPLPVSVNIAPNQNNVCQGASVVMTATPTNGGTPAYQWYKNTLPVGLNQSTYAFTPANGDQVYVVMTSGLSCVSGNPATSNTIAMIVNPILPAGVSIAASQNNICQGTTVTYTATPSNGGTPVYQWYVNNLPVGLNQSTYTNVPANGDQVKVVMTSTLPCISGSPATSNVINMVVNPILPVSVSIVPDQNIVCQGTTVTFTATPINGGIPTYQWYKNTLPVGLNQSTYTDVPVNGDQVYVMMTSNLLCISGSPATSNAVTMVVNAPLPVGVSIFPDQNNVCLGTLVTFTATPANGGAASFQWFVNGIPFGNNQPVFSYFPANGDQVHVVMTSSLTCVTGNPATSNTVSMIVNTPLQAGVSITASQNNVCQGTSVTFTATPVNGGTPVYQWYQNALPVGANQPTYTVVPADGDQVSVLMTSSLSCISGSPAASNTVTMVVVSLPGNAGIIIGSPSVCDGDDQIPYSVAPVANATSYQWTVPAGAVIISGGGTANIIVNFATGASSGAISVMGLNSCGNGGVSPDFQVTVNPIPTTPVVTAVGPDFTSSAPAGNQWFFQGSLIPGATGQTYNASQPGWYWTVVTLNGCTSDTSNHSYLAGVGLDDQTIYTSFTVYPVPNDGRFTISVVVPSAGKYDILIFNAVGKQIFELRDLLIRDVFERTIDLRPLSDGLYPVLLKNSNGSVVRWVLVHK